MKRFNCGFEVLAALGILLLWGAAARADLTIMPLGDSITYGAKSFTELVPGGYRTRLYSDLHDAGYSFRLGKTQQRYVKFRAVPYVGSSPAVFSPRLRSQSHVNRQDGGKIEPHRVLEFLLGEIVLA